ncbi:hypothetical protein ACLKA7_005035 [Drosophila subpalustris]
MYLNGRYNNWIPAQNWRGRGRGAGCGWQNYRPPQSRCTCLCHWQCGKCCQGWQAASPQTDCPLAGWIPIEEAQRGHGWIRVAQPMAQPMPLRWVLLDKDDQIFSGQM